MHTTPHLCRAFLIAGTLMGCATASPGLTQRGVEAAPSFEGQHPLVGRPVETEGLQVRSRRRSSRQRADTGMFSPANIPTTPIITLARRGSSRPSRQRTATWSSRWSRPSHWLAPSPRRMSASAGRHPVGQSRRRTTFFEAIAGGGLSAHAGLPERTRVKGVVKGRLGSLDADERRSLLLVKPLPEATFSSLRKEMVAAHCGHDHPYIDGMGCAAFKDRDGARMREAVGSSLLIAGGGHTRRPA